MNRRDDARHDAAITPAVAIPGRWAERALCAQADPDAWFPDKRPARTDSARHADLCVLPGRAQCLEYALAGADTWGGIATGIWGGTTPQERDQLRRQRKAVAA